LRDEERTAGSFVAGRNVDSGNVGRRPTEKKETTIQKKQGVNIPIIKPPMKVWEE